MPRTDVLCWNWDPTAKHTERVEATVSCVLYVVYTIHGMTE